MPLSEHEQRLLEQMERAFYEEDPQFASAMQRPRMPLGRRTALATVASVLGLATIVVGLASKISLIGVAGFALLLWAASLVLGPRRAQESSEAAPTDGSKPMRRARRSLSERLEQRWDERRGEGR